VTFEGHFSVPLSIFATDEATHFKFGRQLVFGKMLAYGGYFSAHVVRSFAWSVSDSWITCVKWWSTCLMVTTSAGNIQS